MFQSRLITAFRFKAQGDYIAFLIGSADLRDRIFGQAFFSGIVLTFFPSQVVRDIQLSNLFTGLIENSIGAGFFFSHCAGTDEHQAQYE